jgi:putative transposase
MKYAWIQKHSKGKDDWPISMLCEQLGVSISGYHQHQRRVAASKPSTVQPQSKRMSNDALLAHIKAIHTQVKGEYGWPRIWKELLAGGIRVGKERVRRLMKQHGITARAKKRFVVTTDSRHKLPIAANVLERDFSAALPNQVWTSDITYIDTDEGWLFLTVMIDLFSRQVVGWAIKDKMDKALVCDALRMGWFRRQPSAGLIVHTDRGSQYCSKEFQDALQAYGMKSSMSRKGDCWDNAPTESLWGSLKRARIQGKKRFATREQAKAEVMDWLAFYNATRLHSTLNYVSPMQFERNWLAAQVKEAA